MLKVLIIIGLLGSALPVISQVDKTIKINTEPPGVLVTNISGRADPLGYTPLSHVFGFHSDVSVLRLKLSACGYYDTVVKINPLVDALTILMEKKKFIILPDTEEDVLPDPDKKQVTSALVDFLNDFMVRNIKEPVNFMDFAVMKRSGNEISLNMMFELDPEYLSVIRSNVADSVLQSKWEKWFSNSLGKLKFIKLTGQENLKIFFSIISGKKNISIRHIPGVNVHDELKVKTSVYEDDTKRVTTTTFYYETEVNPTFNTTLDQTQKYYELLYEAGKNSRDNGFSLTQKAMISFAKGKLNTIFGTSAEINKYSMLTRFLNKK